MFFRTFRIQSLFIVVLFAALRLLAQSSDSNTGIIKTNEASSTKPNTERIRTECLQCRRLICGKIIRILPDGLVIDSGYTNLMREPLNHSWLVLGTVVADRASNLIEDKQPGSTCIGLVFLTDTPKARRFKPKQYDYVIIEGYPAGQYTYTSLETIPRTVRRFSAVLSQAVELNIQALGKNRVPKIK